MHSAFDTLLQTVVSANIAAANSDNEVFRYECLCCGEEVFLSAQDSIYKAAHFRHRNGNNDKDCELYLGQYGFVPASHSARDKRTERVEFYYQNLHKAFYVSFRFNDSEITAYENSNSYIEIRASRKEKPFFSKKISHTNFADDTPEGFVLEEKANTYFITNTANAIKREYRLFGDIGPTFFKIYGEESDFTAKYIKSNSIYTDVKYFIAWPGRNTAQIHLEKVPGVQIDDCMQFRTMDNCIVWALVATFTDKNPQLDALLQSWGYNLNTSEQLTLLWPPAYENDETLYVSSNTIYVFSSFVLQGLGNINIASNAIHKLDDGITRIDIKDSLRILKKNVDVSVEVRMSPCEKSSITICKTSAKKFLVPDKGMFYCYSSKGVERLSAGQSVFLTETSTVIEYCGNYISTMITLPREEEQSISQRLQEVFSYYWVSIPFEKEIEDNYPESVSKYLRESKSKGRINKAALSLFEEGKNV